MFKKIILENDFLILKLILENIVLYISIYFNFKRYFVILENEF